MHHREWRAELVAHVGEESAPLLLAALQARAHRVEGAGERAHLARATHAHPRREIAAFDAAGGVDEVGERRGEATQTARPGDDDRDARGEDERDRPVAARARELERPHEGRHREGDDRDEHERRQDREEQHAAHETAPHRPPRSVAWRERLVLRPPRWSPARAVPPSPHASGSAKR